MEKIKNGKIPFGSSRCNPDVTIYTPIFMSITTFSSNKNNQLQIFSRFTKPFSDTEPICKNLIHYKMYK